MFTKINSVTAARKKVHRSTGVQWAGHKWERRKTSIKGKDKLRSVSETHKISHPTDST